MLLVLWTVFVGSILSWTLLRQKYELAEIARIQARNSFEKDLVYRRWAAEHGGVYVPTTDKMPPNPYLVNPAYMTRQVHEMGFEQYGSRGHITSLNPIRPANAADEWEAKALQAFEQGVKEVSSVEKLDNENYMRLMRPMITEESCLKCHAEQGYKAGDLRGGISVSIPMAPIQAIARGHALTLAAGHFVLWLLGVGGISLGGQRLKQRIQEHKYAEEQIEILAKFPSENPNPVLRISADGTLLYANHTADSIIQEWDCETGQTVPDMWRKTTVEVLANDRQKRIEHRHDDKIFAFLVVPVTEAGYANLYGRDITDRKAAEEDLQKHRQQLEELVEIRTAELREANKQLMAEIEGRKELEREILDISERERRRLGEELHDSLGQQLTGIAFMAKVLERKLAETSPNEVADVMEIAKLVGQATDQARGLARGLHPLDLGADSLMSSLEELARQTRELIGVRCFFRCDEAVKVDDVGMAVHLYRIAQEAVTNAIKHGKAKNIEIALVCDKDISVMTIRNDGLDFPKEFEARSTGMGLQIMDHRVDLIGGSLDVHAGDEGGTVLTCTFPNKNRG
jgi:signal transduction histidine kinase